jgi:1-acyl-sn-glycerol-3-phosphate acyltransferase
MASSKPITAFALWKTLAISVPVLVDVARGKLTLDRIDRRLDDWSAAILRRTDVHLTVEGRDRVPSGRAYILMSNHQSHFDIPVLYQAWGQTLRMVAKAELFRIPIWGRAMRESGFVPVDRSGNRANAEQAMRACGQAIGRGINIWIAPEGTRSPDGRIAPKLKKGGFLLAAATRTPIVPVSIDGTRLILPKHGRGIQTGVHVKVTFSEPISPEGKKIDALMADVRHAIAAHVVEPGA